MTRYLPNVCVLLLPTLLFAALPAPTGEVLPGLTIEDQVTDHDGTLGSDEKQRLSEMVGRLSVKTGLKTAVLLLSGLDGMSVEELGTAAFNRWNRDIAEQEDRMLFVVWPTQDVIRLEYGEGRGETFLGRSHFLYSTNAQLNAWDEMARTAFLDALRINGPSQSFGWNWPPTLPFLGFIGWMTGLSISLFLKLRKDSVGSAATDADKGGEHYASLLQWASKVIPTTAFCIVFLTIVIRELSFYDDFRIGPGLMSILWLLGSALGLIQVRYGARFRQKPVLHSLIFVPISAALVMLLCSDVGIIDRKAFHANSVLFLTGFVPTLIRWCAHGKSPELGLQMWMDFVCLMPAFVVVAGAAAGAAMLSPQAGLVAGTVVLTSLFGLIIAFPTSSDR